MNSVKETVEHLKIEKNFRLVGFVSDEELPFYYNAADAFVLPSKSGEGLPLVALEAMACALPVIATNVGGISEIMLKGFGKLVPPNQPEQLAEAVVEFAGRTCLQANQSIVQWLKRSTVGTKMLMLSSRYTKSLFNTDAENV